MKKKNKFQNCTSKLNYTVRLKIVSIEIEIEDSQYSVRHKESGVITEIDGASFRKVLPHNFKPSIGQYRRSI